MHYSLTQYECCIQVMKYIQSQRASERNPHEMKDTVMRTAQDSARYHRSTTFIAFSLHRISICSGILTIIELKRFFECYCCGFIYISTHADFEPAFRMTVSRSGQPYSIGIVWQDIGSIGVWPLMELLSSVFIFILSNPCFCYSILYRPILPKLNRTSKFIYE